MSDIDVLVVGAGPVGVTMACELVRHGTSCRILEKAAHPTDKSKALVLWSRTLELLEDMQVVENFLKIGQGSHGASIYAEGKRVIHLSFDEIDSPYNYAWMIPQCDTERLLEANLNRLGLQVERRLQLVEMVPDKTGVTCQISGPDGQLETVRCRYLCACDGAHSTVRHQLNVPFAGVQEPSQWWLADVDVEGPLHRDEYSVFWHDDGPLIFFPMTETRVRIVCMAGLAEGSEKPADPTLEQIQELVSRRGPAGLHCSNPNWLAGFRIHERKVAGYRHGHGRVFLAGDAAHIIAPPVARA